MGCCVCVFLTENSNITTINIITNIATNDNITNEDDNLSTKNVDWYL